MKTTTDFLSNSKQGFCYIVKGTISGMYVDINDLFERDIKNAQAFASYEDAMDYIKNSKYPTLLKPVKYNPFAIDDDHLENIEDEFFTINEAKNDDKYDFWKEQKAN